ncbi:MAG: accessory Sec system translocase SecA2 [Clostridia bacterium]|nr:accessory Sec system translocase SecA2 [Clostridia bacterium]
MLKKLLRLNHVIRNRHLPLEFNLEPYKKVLEKINHMNMETLSDKRLKEMSFELKSLAGKGVTADELLVDAFALVREASWRVLGMRPFDVQVIAGIVLHRGKLAEMQTGEGKTLAAVMPAYLNALFGKGVHILTFNDYLAHRDAAWMGPVYEFLGLKTGYIREGMSIDERQKAYSADITYVTAKEAGFDYLRDFLCIVKEKLIQRPFYYAIVDEADSILIDEARIPLVIAGSVDGDTNLSLDMSRVVRKLMHGVDYEFDQYGRNIYLTERGLFRAEEILGCGNLYAPDNLELLTGLNCALYAENLLQRDKDYIVRGGKIELVDEFTGRVAEKRHWPDNIHAAVEAKEGLISNTKGTIMGSVALQYFLSLYPKISGMTGTAITAALELKEFYGLDVVVIPTHKKCIRKDHPDMIFTHKEAKEKALLAEIKKAHKTGRPVLIGTGSVEESEQLAARLGEIDVPCRVLNAKNDEMEARIIAKAGEIGAVTVSTNMAGRGVDIKLGGEHEQEKEQVVSLGGLYVIGTNHHESRRIDSQLRGRAGRQGDPGESRFFISLEDELMVKYDIIKLIPIENFPKRQEEAVVDPVVKSKIEIGQRIVEGYNGDMRRQLWKYSFIIEQQRRIIHKKRQDILKDQAPLKLFETKAGERYFSLQSKVEESVLKDVEKQITLYYINKCWADYLDYISYIRESIHLVVIGKKNPLDEFHKMAIHAFDKMKERIQFEIVEALIRVQISKDGMDMEKEGMKRPSATWTYLISDNPDQFSNLPFIIKAAVAAFSKPLTISQSIVKRIFGRK